MLALGLAMACGGSSDRSHDAVRFITEDPGAFFDRLDLVDRVVLETWRFETPDDLLSWRPMRFDRRFEVDSGALVLSSSKRHPRLARSVDWQADSVDALELILRSFAGGQVWLYWAGPDEKLSSERSLSARAEPGGRYLLDLAGHPAWTGRIRRLELQLSAAPDRERRLQRIHVLEYRPIAEQVAHAVGRSWKIDLDHEVRSGLLALPEMPVDRRVEVPPSGVLRLGFGMTASAATAIEFSVSIAATERAESPLFATVVDPSRSNQAGRWHDQEVDLSGFAGEEVTLRLVTRAIDAAYDLRDGLPFWSNPVVSVKGQRPARPNILLIVIDTLRPDHLSLYGYPRATSPFLDRWSAEKAVVFEKTVASAPWTIPSHLSIFTGLDALRHGVNDTDHIANSHRLMAEILRDQGYRTLAITGGGFMHPERGFVQGFDRYRYWPEAKSSEELSDGLERALAWLEEKRAQPFFLFFHTFEVHYPYDARQPYFEQLSGGAEIPDRDLRLTPQARLPDSGYLLTKQLRWGDRADPRRTTSLSEQDYQTVVDLYDSSIAYTDAKLEILLTRLEALGVDDHTVIAITSDHGEALGEKGLGGHAYLYDFNLLVPLVLALPDGEGRGERIGRQVRSIDLLPTLLESVGLSPSPDIGASIDGVSLIPLIEGREESHPNEAWSYSAFSNQGLSLRLGNRFKYLFNNTAWPPVHGRDQLFDLRSDPRERYNSVTDGDRAEKFRQKIHSVAAKAEAVLRIRFANACAQPLRGSFRGPSVQINTVKSAGLPDAALTWDQGAATFEVEPGETFDVWVERIVRGQSIVLSGTFGADADTCSGAFTERLGLDAAQGGWQVTHDGDRWSRSTYAASEPPAGPSGIFVHWQRKSRAETDAGAFVESPEVLEQLRALGYVE